MNGYGEKTGQDRRNKKRTDMSGYDERAGQVWASRQEKVMAAKAAFGNAPVPKTGHFSGMADHPRSQGIFGDTSLEDGFRDAEEEDSFAVHFHFGLMRFMASAMLLILLLAAFSAGFSYHGFDKAYVKEKMDEDRAWNQLEDKVQGLAGQAVQAWKNANP